MAPEEIKAEGISRKMARSSTSCIDDAFNTEPGIMTEILLRLPSLDEIFRCKSVSKQWLSLIQDPQFSAAYTNKRMMKKKKATNSSSSKQQLVPITNSLKTASILLWKHHDDEDEEEEEEEKSSCRLKFSIDFLPYLPYKANLDYLLGDSLEVYDARPNMPPSDYRIHRVFRTTQKRQWARYDTGGLKLFPRIPFQLPEPNLDPKAATTDRRYYYNHVVGSSNGLLLCSPFPGYPNMHAICNPNMHTKQWYPIPIPPPVCFSTVAHVGFMVLLDRSSFVIVRIPISRQSRHSQLNLEVLSSESAVWTVRSAALPRPLHGPDLDARFGDDGSVTFAVNLRGRWMCWMLGETQQVVVYDPVNNVVDSVIERPDHALEPLRGFDNARAGRYLDGICVSQDCLWAVAHNYPILTIFRAERLQLEPYFKRTNRVSLMGPWLSEFPFIVNRVDPGRYHTLITGPSTEDVILTLNPVDPNQVYLTYHHDFLALFDVAQRKLKLLGGQGSLGPPLHM